MRYSAIDSVHIKILRSWQRKQEKLFERSAEHRSMMSSPSRERDLYLAREAQLKTLAYSPEKEVDISEEARSIALKHKSDRDQLLRMVKLYPLEITHEIIGFQREVNSEADIDAMIADLFALAKHYEN